jgi:hypothetical protein
MDARAAIAERARKAAYIDVGAAAQNALSFLTTGHSTAARFSVLGSMRKLGMHFRSSGVTRRPAHRFGRGSEQPHTAHVGGTGPLRAVGAVGAVGFFGAADQYPRDCLHHLQVARRNFVRVSEPKTARAESHARTGTHTRSHARKLLTEHELIYVNRDVGATEESTPWSKTLRSVFDDLHSGEHKLEALRAYLLYPISRPADTRRGRSKTTIPWTFCLAYDE